jgi:Amt family ammonium transporter
MGKKWIGRRIDDGGDVFVIHGLGGIAGALALPLFVQPQLGGVGFEAGISLGGAILAQLIGVVAVALWAAVGSAIVALLLSAVMVGRGTAQDEAEGLDAGQHGQQGWDFR